MDRIIHDLRLSETVSPFGVGAIVDVLGESLIAPDTSWWDHRHAQLIACERLLKRLGPGELRQAPTHAGHAATKSPHLLYWRFPEWRFCERCSTLSRVTGKAKGRWRNICKCNGKLVPMRYVAVCNGGSHMRDVPWFTWAHRGHDKDRTEAVRFCRAYTELKFVRSARHGEGLASLRVECNACKRSRPLSELVGETALRNDGIRCEGTQPWENAAKADLCEAPLRAVQRGATGNYISDTLSALDIPEEVPRRQQFADRIRGHIYFTRLVADNGGPQSDIVAGWIADEIGVSVQDVLDVAASGDDAVEEPLLDLKDGEWSAFLSKLDHGRDPGIGDFVVDGRFVDASRERPSSLTNLIAGIGQVRRVREVRALRGFRRFDAAAVKIPSDLSRDRRRPPVYPAIEVFGEGVFLRFAEDRLAEWEQDADVRKRAEILVARRRDSGWAQRLDVPEARFVALHTIAHLLIRRLAYESGYASASLRERIYANTDRRDPTAGILIYTATGDEQGTLGGLVRLGAPENLLGVLVDALCDADVCSNDPVCIESDRQGSSQLNLSACHGCTLVSETSCETSNRLLDRQLVLGGTQVRGLLEGVVDQVRVDY